jgi:flavodoxin
MKIKLLFFAMLTLLLPSCVHSQAQIKGKKILIVYYSYSGNTRTVAKQIQKGTSGDIFEIQPVESYPTEYDAVVEQAKQEIGKNYHPALKTKLEGISKYDVIFVGSPCWWGTIAPPVATFLSSYDLSYKTIIPFMTHEGSRMGHSENDIKKICPKSTVLSGLPIRGSDVNSSENKVMNWLIKFGFKK